MKQITEQIIKIFKDNNLKAVQGEWGLVVEHLLFTVPNNKCCGLAALLVNKAVFAYEDKIVDDPTHALKLSLNMTDKYIEGFCHGFDGAEKLKYDSAVDSLTGAVDFLNGAADGLETWNELVKLNLTAEKESEEQY